MARQKGVLSLEGKAGNFSFFQGRDGYGARTSDGMNGSRIAEDEAFKRTRENGMEFGRAGKAGKLLRTALRPILVGISDSKVTSRLTTQMLRVVKSDPINDRGDRTAMHGELELLNGFEFNVIAPIRQTVFAEFTAAIDRATGTGTVSLPSFDPAKMIASTPGATHYSLLLGIVSANFDVLETKQAMLFGDALALNTVTAQSVLTVKLPEASEDPIFLAFGIEFMQIVNGKKYGLNNSDHKAMAIVAVEMGI